MKKTTDKYTIKKISAAVTMVCMMYGNTANAQLPDVPVPTENPITEEKRVLGKILFWDEQLSSNDSIACGTCHIPNASGADPRDPATSINPGIDGVFGTDDDIVGSRGIALLDSDGNAVEHPFFGFEPQVGDRAASSLFGHMWADELFWDGRATSEFLNPLDNTVVIGSGGSLESQAVGPILNSIEMAKEDRQWSEVTSKLEQVTPLSLATNLPSDMALALQDNSSYPALFESAFGDTEITPVRIAFAIATYQRTLVPDQTPFDLGTMTQAQQIGLNVFVNQDCSTCHTPPLFSDNNFFNIGLTPSGEDEGRFGVTGVEEDRGEMKVPSLRGVGLRETYMHTGEFTTLNQVLGHYNNPAFNQDRDNIPGGGNYDFNITGGNLTNLIDFLANALTDPRVEAETFPFDRPTLNSENPNPTQVPTPTPVVTPAPVVTPEPVVDDITMPTLVGMTLTAARRTIRALDLSIDDINSNNRNNDINDDDIVSSQSPVAGVVVTADTDIDITVSTDNNNNRNDNNRNNDNRNNNRR